MTYADVDLPAEVDALVEAMVNLNESPGRVPESAIADAARVMGVTDAYGFRYCISQIGDPDQVMELVRYAETIMTGALMCAGSVTDAVEDMGGLVARIENEVSNGMLDDLWQAMAYVGAEVGNRYDGRGRRLQQQPQQSHPMDDFDFCAAIEYSIQMPDELMPMVKRITNVLEEEAQGSTINMAQCMEVSMRNPTGAMLNGVFGYRPQTIDTCVKEQPDAAAWWQDSAVQVVSGFQDDLSGRLLSACSSAGYDGKSLDWAVLGAEMKAASDEQFKALLQGRAWEREVTDCAEKSNRGISAEVAIEAPAPIAEVVPSPSPSPPPLRELESPPPPPPPSSSPPRPSLSPPPLPQLVGPPPPPPPSSSPPRPSLSPPPLPQVVGPPPPPPPSPSPPRPSLSPPTLPKLESPPPPPPPFSSPSPSPPPPPPRDPISLSPSQTSPPPDPPSPSPSPSPPPPLRTPSSPSTPPTRRPPPPPPPPVPEALQGRIAVVAEVSFTDLSLSEWTEEDRTNTLTALARSLNVPADSIVILKIAAGSLVIEYAVLADSPAEAEIIQKAVKDEAPAIFEGLGLGPVETTAPSINDDRMDIVKVTTESAPPGIGGSETLSNMGGTKPWVVIIGGATGGVVVIVIVVAATICILMKFRQSASTPVLPMTSPQMVEPMQVAVIRDPSDDW